MSKTLDEYNEARGNLSLEDTQALLRVSNLMGEGEISEAYLELLEFIVERGYDENPVDKYVNRNKTLSAQKYAANYAEKNEGDNE